MSDVEAWISQLTLEEKAALVTGATYWETTPVERLGIPAIYLSDGPHGLRKVKGHSRESLPATCFPTASALGATWNRELMFEIGQALARECIAQQVDILLGPGINLKRTPLCGRNFEYFSEDPFLAGELGASYVNGVQSLGVGTSLKHFAANNQETGRMTVDVQIDERTLHELYLAAFERVVKKANPWTVMCAYNRLNGTHCSENHTLLTGILRDRWGYDGAVVSDWGAVHDRVRALLAGLDLEMPGPQPQRTARLVDAVREGRVTEAQLDESVRRILALISTAQKGSKSSSPVDHEAHHALARRAAAEAMVLLKNEGSILPLNPTGRLAVIGLSASQPVIQGGGSSLVNPIRIDQPLEALQQAAPGVEWVVAPGYRYSGELDLALIDEAVAAASSADTALLFVANSPGTESEGYDRSDIRLSDQQVALIQAVTAVQPRSIVVINNGAAIEMSEWIDGPAAVLEAWFMGQAGAGAIADVLFGQAEPGGRLAESFPLHLEDTPAFLNYPGENNQVRYGEGLFIGYRYYDARQQNVLFPFGYGLSYTTFALTDLIVDPDTVQSGAELGVKVTITNTGERSGQTVAQVYIRPLHPNAQSPVKTLQGFAKVTLQPGESQVVSIPLDTRAFSQYDVRLHDWVTFGGTYEILVGQSSQGPFLSERVTVEASPPVNPLTPLSTVAEWRTHPKGSQILQMMIDAFLAMQAAGGPDFSVDEMLKNADPVPLSAALALSGLELPMTPEEITQFLLDQANSSQ